MVPAEALPMAQDKTNPFVLPGFGQKGDAAQNPLFAGLEMMRQAWQNMAGAGHMDAALMPPLSLEELDRRIRELQTVQNWLQLNATMLANTIQGLEIQRSTVRTLKSLAGQGLAGAAAATDAAAGASGSDYTQAAEDWWKLVREQFDGLAAATTASLQGVADAAKTASQPASRKRAAAGKAASSGKKPSTGSSAKRTSRPAARRPRT
jgi:hypothetical protein